MVEKKSCNCLTVALSNEQRSKSNVLAETSYCPVSAISCTTFCRSALSLRLIILCCKSRKISISHYKKKVGYTYITEILYTPELQKQTLSNGREEFEAVTK